MRFDDKLVVITGAGQGLGAEFAKEFAAEGAMVILLGRTGAKVEKVAEDIRAKGQKAYAIECDISVPEQVQRSFQEIREQFGTVDALINNAAYYASSSILDTSIEAWKKHIDTNLNGTFYCVKEVLPGMIEKRYGKIINMSSSGAELFFPGFGAYAASKGGIISMSRILSEEVKQYGINVNAIYLGMIAVQPTRGLDIGAIEFVRSKLIEERKRQTAVLLISTDLEEILSLSDRILVMCNGEFMPAC